MRRDDDRAIPDREHTVEGCRTRAPEDGLDGCALVVKANRDRGVGPGIRELVASIRGIGQRHTQVGGRLLECPRLIPRRRREQQDAVH
jgi:hypothetical protein